MSNTVTLENSSNQVVGTFSTIQDAVNFAETNQQNGDTVLVGPGTYQEQVLVDGSQISSIAIVGAGQSQTTILSPDAADLQPTLQNPDEFHSNQDALVGVVNGASVTVQNLTIDGNNQGVVYATGSPPDGGDLVGIEALSSSLTVNNVHVTGVEDLEPGNGGLQGGQGNKAIIVDDRDGSARAFTLTGSTIDNFQKDGVLMEGTGLTVNVDGNTITGVGTGATKLSQNLIELDSGAIGSITQNVLTGISDANFGSLGILVFQPGSGVVVSNNTITGETGNVNSSGIYFAAADSASADANTIADQGFALTEDGANYGAFITALLQDNNSYSGNVINYSFYAEPTQTPGFTVTGTGGPDDLEGDAGNDVVIVLGGAPNGNTFIGNGGIDTVQGYDASITLAIQSGHWVATNGSATDTLTGIEKVVSNGQTFDLVDQLGADTGGFQGLQDAVNAAQSGDIVLANDGTSPVNVSVTVDNLTFEPSQTYTGITLTLGTGVHSVALADFSPGQGTAVTIIANNLGDTISGNDAADQFTGGAGNDTFVVLDTATRIDQFSSGDLLDLPNLAFAEGATASYDTTNDLLTVVSNGVTDTLTMTGVAGTIFKAFNDGSGGTDIGFDQPPVLDGDFPTIYYMAGSELGPAVLLASGVTISDPDNTTLASATVTVAGGGAGDDDALVLPGSTGLTVTINGDTYSVEHSGSPNSMSLTITGVGPIADYQQLLDEVQFQTDAAANQSQTASWSVTDPSGAVSNSATQTIHIFPNYPGNTDEWILSDGQWVASAGPGLHPGPDGVAGIGDFNHDGTSDILWYAPGSGGDVDEWVINNSQWAGSIDLGQHPGANSQIAGVGDFNGDGTDDVLWTNFSDGQIQTDIWELQNGQWINSVSPGPHPAGFVVAGVGDFNADGTSDVLWFDPATQGVDEWQIVNGQWAGSINVGTHPGSGWQIAGIGDFNGDGTDDVLWTNSSSGQVQTDIWELSNGQWEASVSPGSHPAGYQVAGVGDFTGNGQTDILWYNPGTHDVDEWELSNGQWTASVDLGPHPGSGWQIAGIGDFTGSGTQDILWHNVA